MIGLQTCLDIKLDLNGGLYLINHKHIMTLIPRIRYTYDVIFKNRLFYAVFYLNIINDHFNESFLMGSFQNKFLEF